MKPTPTGFAALNAIYNRYHDTFSNYKTYSSSPSSKMYVPLDIAAVPKDLMVNEDIIFGRLYYHLEKEYGHDQKDGSRVHFFAMVLGDDPDCVHFLYAASVLAGLRDEHC
ncbi:MAG: hypothetical protein QF579_01690 [Dehalococcoidia bacterium]|jgi:hypothetical protein|nr:hypothetical protein [Dehalococcoidia bacterium]